MWSRSLPVSIVAAIFCGSFLFAGEIFGPRISFTRVQPAPVNLGSIHRLAIAEVKREPETGRFAAKFAEIAERDGILTIVEKGNRPGPQAADALVYVAIDECASVPRQKEHRHGGESVESDNWYDTRCSARVRIADSRSGGTVAEYDLTARASSHHETSLSDALRIEAEREAVEQLADFAASKVTPRRIIESIRLDNTAPRFEEVYALIRDDRFAEARQIWTNELKKNPRSAALRLDLGAVCEALGDNAAARHLYEAAIAVDPMNDRYGKAIEELDHRALDAAMLQLRPTALR